MARYAISAEGAASMRALAKQLYTEANAILEASAALEAKVSAVGDGLGIYETEILGLIQQVKNALKTNRDDILDLAQRVIQKADEIDALVALSLGGVAGAISSGKCAAKNTFSMHSDKLSEGFINGMQQVLNGSSHADVRNVYEKCADKLLIHDAQSNDTGAYFVQGEGVTMNANNVAIGSRIHKPYQVAFHEFGHNIDFILGRGSPISENWGGGALLRAIQADFDMLKGTMTNEELVAKLRQEKIKNGWSNMDIASVSDILECMTGIDYPLGAGHGKESKPILNGDGTVSIIKVSYWENRLPCKEFFAEVLDGAAANEGSYNMLKQFFPNAVKVVHQIIGGVAI